MSLGGWRIVLGLLIVGALAGCGAQGHAAGAKAKVKGPSATAVRPRLSANPPTETECNAFAEAFEQAIERDDVAAANNLIDWGALYERASGGLGFDAKFREGFLSGLNRSVYQQG